MTIKYDYASLSKLDETRYSDNDNYAKEVKVILKEFLFTKLKSSEIFNEEDLVKVRHSIINFFYCGKFTLKCENPIVYDDKAQNELAIVSNIANEIRHTESKISIVEENLINNPKDTILLCEKVELVNELKRLKRKQKSEGKQITKIVSLQDGINILSEKEYSTKNAKEIQKKEKEIQKILSSIKDTPEDFFYKIEKSWDHVTKTYEQYIEKLNVQLKNSKIDKIIVYEAPPYLGHKDLKETYFLTSKDPTYSSPIRECFDSKKENENLSMIEFLAKYKIGFFDLSMACLPLSDGDIRKNWNRNPEFKFGDKQLTVILFELSLEHFIKKINFKIVKHPLFAIGTPVNTSAGIFEHYSQNLLKVYKDKKSNNIYFETKNNATDKDVLFVDLGVTNTTSTFMKRDAKGITFPLFKSNIISTGYPNAELMRNAFNIDK
jgi:hypothetical protein